MSKFLSYSPKLFLTLAILGLFLLFAYSAIQIGTYESKNVLAQACPVTNATVCTDYIYNIQATDPNGHTMEYFDLTESLPDNLEINQTTGQITGQPQNIGTYPIQIEIRDEYFNYTMPPYSAQAIHSYNLKVADEMFTVIAPEDNAFYTIPEGVAMADLYYLPITYFGIAEASTPNTVIWTITTDPLPGGLTIVINPATGQIDAIALGNTTTGIYNITVTATTNCNSSYSDTFELTVAANPWCGDNIIQEDFLEECDDGAGNTDIPCVPPPDSVCAYCDTLCQSRAIINIIYNDAVEWGFGGGINIISGQEWLEVNPITTPYIWVASSGSDEVYRIDTATNVLAGPFAVGDNPSRTAVAINGDVWVGNRSSANVSHLDTNGALIKTCAVGGGPRGVAIDAEGNVWIGNHSDGTIYKLDYDTCAVLENINVGGNPYGAAVDGLNNLWISNRGAGQINKIDTASASLVFSVAPGNGPYGIAIDKNNNIWSALWEGQGVTKINQAGDIEFTINLGMPCRAIAVDKDNNIWVTHTLNDKVTKLDNNGNVIFSVCTDSNLDCNTTIGASPIGVTATADGYIWVVNYTTHSASKINPDTGVIEASVNVGLQPYTYSDMAGYMLRAVTLAGGSWTVDVDGTITTPSWDTLSWTEVEPGDSYARVRVRSAATQAGLSSAVWSSYFDTPPVDLSSIVFQRWLQIQVDIHLSTDDESPIVDDLTIVGG